MIGSLILSSAGTAGMLTAEAKSATDSDAISAADKRKLFSSAVHGPVKVVGALRKLAGKTLGVAGINLSVASLLRQSQVFTGLFGSFMQIIGAFVDMTLAPFMPDIFRFFKWLSTKGPHFAKFMESLFRWVWITLEWLVGNVINPILKFLDIDTVKWPKWGGGGSGSSGAMLMKPPEKEKKVTTGMFPHETHTFSDPGDDPKEDPSEDKKIEDEVVKEVVKNLGTGGTIYGAYGSTPTDTRDLTGVSYLTPQTGGGGMIGALTGDTSSVAFGGSAGYLKHQTMLNQINRGYTGAYSQYTGIFGTQSLDGSNQTAQEQFEVESYYSGAMLAAMQNSEERSFSESRQFWH